MKKLIFLFAMVFAVSFAFAQHDGTLIQGGAAAKDNTGYTVQESGSGNDLYIEQIINNGGDPGTATNTAGVSTTDPILQRGYNNVIDLQQIAGATGAGLIIGVLSGPNNLAKIRQVGNRNKLVGATSDGQIDVSSRAYQRSGMRWNALDLDQRSDNNRVGLYQYGVHCNYLDGSITQEGSDLLVVYQNSSTMGNKVNSDQDGGNVARVKQTGTGINELTIDQSGGNNRIAGAYNDGSINTVGPAIQDNTASGNNMDISQYGGGNVAGLYQWAGAASVHENNDASITQYGGNNSLGAYQLTTDGTNTLSVTQSGDSEYTLQQDGTGNNVGNVIQ